MKQDIINIKLRGLLLFVITGLLLPHLSYTQQPVAPPPSYNSNIKVNYVRTFDAKAPDTSAANLITRPLKDVKQTTAYFDGLGRPLQTVVKQGSLATGNSPVDMVSAVVYDAFGREQYKYLPFAANGSSDGLFKLDPFLQQVQFYNTQLTGQPGETNVGTGSLNWAYGQTTFESSPLNRVQETFAPGSSWVGTAAEGSEANRHSVKAKYYINTATDDVRIWTVTDVTNDWGTYATTATYPAGELYKNITVDEHGKQVIEFKDKEGQVILKKVQLTATADDGAGSGYTGWLCTYYIYDDLNRLRLVIQPRGVEHLLAANWTGSILTNVINNLSFRYEYDTRSRMIRKLVPGGGESWMVYDARDRLVLSQTAQMRYRHQWLYTQYDELNRPLATGLIVDDANYNNLTYHLTAASGSTTYPDLNNYTPNELTRNFYDDYTWIGTYSPGLTSTYDNTYDTYLHAASASWPYPQANTASTALTGLVTGTRAKVLGGSSTFLYTLNIYDDKGRIIQTKAINITNGEDVTTTQYAWDGKPLVVVQKQRKSGTNPQTQVVITKMEYDDLGRLLTSKKAVNNTIGSNTISKPEQVIVSHEYDPLGQLKKKTLAPTGGPGGTALESIEHKYNVRGWSLGVNHSYLVGPWASDHWFGYTIGYDQTNGNGGYYTYFNGSQYNGNITGIMWKSRGDGMQRKYDFTYDAVNRLTGGDYNQQNGLGWDRTAGLDFSVSNLSYDANGNILTMQHKGWKPGGSETIDNLTYNYYGYSNQLRNVIDGANDPQTKLGDFRASAFYTGELTGGKTATTNDYIYDYSGNLVRDRNKDIGDASTNGITNNHLNLPSKIDVFSATGVIKGSVSYTYDALGNKLRKVVQETGKPNKITLYLGGAVYENDTLQFIGHEEGRLRYVKRHFTNGDSAYQFQYDYFLKDHLGNVRMVLTEQTDTMQYLASMETAYRTKEEQLFYNIPQTAVNKSTIAGYPTDPNPVTDPNDLVAKVNGSGNKVGPAMVLKVMSGDKVDIGVKSFYKSGGTAGVYNDPVADLITSLASGIVGVAGESKGSLATLNGGSSPLIGAMNTFRSGNNPNQPTKPKAYLNWILLDEQLKYVAAGSGAQPVQSPDAIYALATPGELTMPKNGFLYIYVSNETQNWDVFFDNLSIQHTTGPITEETHYYPFGLTMAGISSTALRTSKNCGCGIKKGFNGNELQQKEFSDGSGLDFYDFNARTYDQQIGRFIQIDPIPDEGEQESLTPYHFGGNNPITFSDADGKCPWCIPIIIIGLLTVSPPAVAPTGKNSDGPAIKAAHDRAGFDAAFSLIPGARQAKVSQTLFARKVLKESAKKELAKNAAKVAQDEIKEVFSADPKKNPESAQHATEAIKDGVEVRGVIDRPGAPGRRKENLKDVKTQPGKDRDEFPPAVIKTTGKVSVKLISSGDNRSAGAYIGQQIRNLPDGTRVVLRIKPRE